MIPFDSGESTGNSVVDRIFQRLSTTLDSIARLVTNDHVTRVTFTAATTDVQVRHGLNGPAQTFEVVDLNAAAIIFRSPTVNTRPRDMVILQASAPCTALVRFT